MASRPKHFKDKPSSAMPDFSVSSTNQNLNQPLYPPASVHALDEIDLKSYGKTNYIGADAIAQAEAIASEDINELPITKDPRFQDLTSLDFFTVDPKSKHDIDDALYFETNKDGSITAYVAIACVAPRIEFGSPLDMHRRDHPMAIFLPNSAIHTMPSCLYEPVDGALSLCEGKDRLAVVHKFDIPLDCESLDDINCDIFPAKIRSRAALNYGDFLDLLSPLEATDIGESVLPQSCIDGAVEFAYRLDGLMTGLRFTDTKTSLSFDEGGILSTAQGRRAHLGDQVIELAALLTAQKSTDIVRDYNDTSREKTLPFAFRVQAVPDKDDLMDSLAELEGVFPESVHDSLFDMLEDTHQWDLDYADTARMVISDVLMNSPSGMGRDFVSRCLIQATEKARFSPDEASHFSLNTTTGQVTSPLRRYTDTINQWAVLKALEYDVGELEIHHEGFKALCDYVSSEERTASSIQKMSRKRRIIERIESRGLDSEEALRIRCITRSGIILQTGLISGLLPSNAVPYTWHINRKTQTVTLGENSNNTFGIGDILPVAISLGEAKAGDLKLSFKIDSSSQRAPHSGLNAANDRKPC